MFSTVGKPFFVGEQYASHVHGIVLPSMQEQSRSLFLYLSRLKTDAGLPVSSARKLEKFKNEWLKTHLQEKLSKMRGCLRHKNKETLTFSLQFSCKNLQ